VTPLARTLAGIIRAAGPIGVDRFMAAALGDPTHGYYMTRDPLGRAGDFITAPEISQIFGEILGLWCAEAWRRMGAPDTVALVELGPGRGTLMADMLRAMKILPGCRAAVRPHLVETSPVLRARQQATLADAEARWHDSLDSVPRGPMLLVANEFFDALPIRQWLKRDGVWHERLVALDDAGDFDFEAGPPAMPPACPDAPDGAIFESCEPAREIATAIGRRLAHAPGAALLIDYGHGVTAPGETLQAVRAHRFAPPLADPGEADLTAHVDFAGLADALRQAGAAVAPLETQGRFLAANGAELRARTLMRGKDDETAAGIGQSLRRLLDPAKMGRLFKVLVATSPEPAA
jgi:NADH dehydrogenase [ubiquinone] 1 alpha subcomplex assembly factor 7